mgnify:CR=1 FL=1
MQENRRVKGAGPQGANGRGNGERGIWRHARRRGLHGVLDGLSFLVLFTPGVIGRGRPSDKARCIYTQYPAIESKIFHSITPGMRCSIQRQGRRYKDGSPRIVPWGNPVPGSHGPSSAKNVKKCHRCRQQEAKEVENTDRPERKLRIAKRVRPLIGYPVLSASFSSAPPRSCRLFASGVGADVLLYSATRQSLMTEFRTPPRLIP